MKIPKYEIFRRPECKERDKDGEGLVRTAPGVGDENVKAEHYKKEECEEVKQDEHELEHRTNRRTDAIPFHPALTRCYIPRISAQKVKVIPKAIGRKCLISMKSPLRIAE